MREPVVDMSVAVVVRCHQQGRFLPDAIASVNAQSKRPSCIVVVDDGSTDETNDVLKQLALATLFRFESRLGLRPGVRWLRSMTGFNWRALSTSFVLLTPMTGCHRGSSS